MLVVLFANGAPERIRTSDPQIRSLVLYPAELRARCGDGTKPVIVPMNGRGFVYLLPSLMASLKLMISP